ncbi:hydroxyacylglutathione hydrolase [Desulforhopalus sp. 52FAK]
MKVEIIPCHFDNFSYLLICEETGTGAIVDPAEYYPVSRKISELNIDVVAIYCTHHHADHIGGLEEMYKEYPGIEVAGFVSDAARIPHLTTQLKDGDSVQFGNVKGSVKHTPGHTSGGICYLFGDHLFTGDTLFGGGCGRLFEGTPEQMYNSLHGVTDGLAEDVKIYFGHEYTISNLKFAQFIEPENEDIACRFKEANATLEKGGATTPSTVGLERQTNPFLRSRIDSVRKGLIDKLLLEDSDPVSVFTAIRRLKDSY